MAPRPTASWIAIIVVATGAMSACVRADIAPTTAAEKAHALELSQMFREPVTFEEAAAINNAHAEIVETCMNELGWELRLGRDTAEELELGWFMRQPESWLFEDLAAARSHGYGWYDLTIRSAAVDEVQQTRELLIPMPEDLSISESERFQRDIGGSEGESIRIETRSGGAVITAGGGCLNVANSTIYGDIRARLEFEDLRTHIAGDVLVRTLDDRTVRSALRAWRGCVLERGYRLDDPPMAVKQAGSMYVEGPDRAVLEKEVQLALADVTCKHRSLLSDAFSGVFVRHAETQVTAFDSELKEYSRFMNSAAERAMEVAGSTP